METEQKDWMVTLKKLHGIDLQILELEDKLEAYPNTIATMEAEAEEKSAKLAEHQEARQHLASKAELKEVDLKAKDEEITKLQSQLKQIASNQEYTAMIKQISHQKSEKSSIEDETNRFLNQVAAEDEKISALQAEIDEITTKVKATQDESQGAITDIESKLDVLYGEREQFEDLLDEDQDDQYERLFERYNGDCLSALVKQVCQGCFTSVPAYVETEIKKDEGMVPCQRCGRILYLPEEEERNQILEESFAPEPPKKKRKKKASTKKKAEEEEAAEAPAEEAPATEEAPAAPAEGEPEVPSPDQRETLVLDEGVSKEEPAGGDAQ